MSINIEENNQEIPKKEEIKQEKHHLNRKIIDNAISAYPLILVSSMFLFNKKDENINNSFVKAHTKSALVLHLGFLLTYIIFINIGFLKSIPIFSGYGLNIIISILLFLGLFCGLIYGGYKAHLGKYFLLGNIIKIPEVEKFSEEDANISINEKNKLIVILSFIPFVGYYFYSEHKDKVLIRNTIKFNMLCTIIIVLLFISNSPVLGSLVILGYIVFVVYSILNLITKNEIPHIKLNFIFSAEDSFLILKGLKKYLKAFNKKEEFITLKEVLSIERKKFDLEEENNLKELETKTESKFPKQLIYIPIVNLIFLFSPNTKYIYHIRSGLTITFLIIIISFLGSLSVLSIFFLFPIIYGTGYINTRLAYKMPYIYWIYEKLSKYYFIILGKADNIKKIKQQNKEESLKVKNIKKEEIKNGKTTDLKTQQNKVIKEIKQENIKDFDSNDFVEIKEESSPNNNEQNLNNNSLLNEKSQINTIKTDDFLEEEDNNKFDVSNFKDNSQKLSDK